jgi:hypothetical protein
VQFPAMFLYAFFLVASSPLLVSHDIIWVVIFLDVLVSNLRDFWFLVQFCEMVVLR